MWNINFEKLVLIAGNLGGIAIETGTCRGNGAKALAKHFSRVITIELSEALSNIAKDKLSGGEFAHIEFVTGDSSLELPRVLSSLPEQETVFLFLDAHWSGDKSVQWADSGWKGYGLDTAHRGPKGCAPSSSQQCPLVEELVAIMKCCRGSAFVLIDDMKNIPPSGAGLRNHTFPGEDWSHLSFELLLKIVDERLVKFHKLEQPEQLLLEMRPLATLAGNSLKPD